jgi:hypothetical protein
MSIRRSSLRGQAIAAVILFLAAPAQPMSAQISNVLIPVPGKTSMVSIDQFKPDLVVPDSVFECGTPEAHPADLLLPVDAMVYSAAVPSRANEMRSMIAFVDSTGSILRFAERRGEPIGRTLDVLGKPADLVARVVAMCRPRR